MSYGDIDPASFTLIRIVSGAFCLWLIVAFKQKMKRQRFSRPSNNASWTGVFALFGYCAAFSVAYVNLDTGIGALALFGAVQLTVIVSSIVKKEASSWATWLGTGLAFMGLIYLVMPSDLSNTNVPIDSFAIMLFAGICWGIYTLKGRASSTPLEDTTFHFSGALIVCMLFAAFYTVFNPMHFNLNGLALGLASGAVTSGLGYAIWYSALPSLSRIQAGVVQLTVPVIAAFGGLIFVSEPFSIQFIIAALLVLSGVLMTLILPKAG